MPGWRQTRSCPFRGAVTDGGRLIGALLGVLAIGSSCLADTLPAGAIPDDPALREQLEDALDLRRRDVFDRFLDARESGELLEHATLTELDFEHRDIGIDTLFIVGDELFGYLFRPENGWGTGGVDRNATGYTPRQIRVQRGDSGGPDAFGCFSCHSKGGPDGAGTRTQNAFLRGDGERAGSADERNPPHLLGLGPVAALAIEMSVDLRRQADAAIEEARARGQRVEHALSAKGVAFGRIVAEPDGRLDTSRIEGVDADLTIRPFGWKGHQATLRGMVEESFHIHQGLVSTDIQVAVRDKSIDGLAYGGGKHWFDLDNDGVSREIDSGMLSTMVGYLVQLEAPLMRPPREPGLLDAFAAGRAHFDAIGCAACHVPTLELDDPRLEVRPPARQGSTFVVNVAKDGESPKIEAKFAAPDTPYLVHLFSDLKRHDMGRGLASRASQAAIPASVFLTRSLWGLAETAPYLHDGRAPTVHEAVVLHGGEAEPARNAYLALDESSRAGVRVFLMSLSRQPKLFLP
jgi:hypothetical protein